MNQTEAGGTRYTAPSLASVLGVSGTIANASSLDIPWVYVASKKGAIAVFPGTGVIASKEWVTTTRPWFDVAFHGKLHLSSGGCSPDDHLTATYLDVLANSPILVRTYLHKFSVGQDEFVICIDFHLRNEGLPVVSPLAAFRETIMGPFRPLHLVALGLSLFMFAAFRWIVATDIHTIAFERTKIRSFGLHNDTELDEVKTEEQKKKQSTFKISVGQTIQVGGESTQDLCESSVSTVQFQKTRLNLRGSEVWEVYAITRKSWHLRSLRFESVIRVPIGTIKLAYTADIIPQVLRIDLNKQVLSQDEEENLREHLPAILSQNTDLWDKGNVEVQGSLTGVRSLPNTPRLPDPVPRVAEEDKLFAIHRHRAYVSLSRTDIAKLYANAQVRAVVLASYFERLLEAEQTEFLLLGKTIHRLVSFPSKDVKFALPETLGRKFDDLRKSYSSGRILRRVDIAIPLESTPELVYDFAILDDSLVVVTHNLLDASVIDRASGRETGATYIVQGYLSWRRSDVSFYRDYFEYLAEQSRELDLDTPNASHL